MKWIKKTIQSNNKGHIKTQANKFINRNNRKRIRTYITGNKALNQFETGTPLFHESKNICITLIKKNAKVALYERYILKK